jgi:CheY-like chemotaxis protein
MPGSAYILWTAQGLSCRLGRAHGGWQVSLEAREGAPFLRRFAYSQRDAANQAEYLRLLLDRSRARVRRGRERQPVVLIVDDDPENLHAYEEMLRVEGFRTASASTLAAARRLLREVRPSAILLDHVLPDGDGPMLARELRQSCADAAVVLVTGTDPAAAAQAYDGAPDARLRKPCRPETLARVLKLLVERAAVRAPEPRGSDAAGTLTRASCPLCGIAGALVDGEGRFHCQQCGQEGRMARDLCHVETQL